MIILKDTFKSYLIHVSIGHPFQKEMDVFSVVLDQYLKASHPMYSSRQAITEALEDMYGLRVSLYTTVDGNYLMHHLRCKMLNPQLVLDPTLLEQVLHHLTQMIFHANIDNEKRFLEEKTRLIHQFESIKDDKQGYASYLYEEQLMSHTHDIFHLEDKITQLKDIQINDIQTYYQNTFKEANVICFATGAFTEDDITTLERHLKPYEKGVIHPFFKPYPNEGLTHVHLKMEMNQAMLHLGYNTDILYHSPHMTTLQVLNEILGGHANSRLFQEVRENRGLCYSIYSYLNLNHGILTISTGVDHKRLEETKEAINQVINHLQNHLISEDELNQAKEYMIHQIQSSLDRQSIYIQRAYRDHIYQEQYNLETRLQHIKRVTKEDIMKISRQLNLMIAHQVSGASV
jgi:predicted Zn-dependent peptidase